MMNHKNVAIFGGGIAGLTAAHELARRGWHVTVFESTNDLGGFFRSSRLSDSSQMPTEYSWHGFGPWYHNTFDLLKQIPFDERDSIYDRGLSRPIDFGLAPDHGQAQFHQGHFLIPVSKMFRMRGLDSLRWGYLMFKTWTCNRRSHEFYSRINAAEAWKPWLSHQGWLTWRACFGPWIGSDWTNVSLHQTGEFFRKQLMTEPPHEHRADSEGPAWKQGKWDGWLLMRGPSSECWFQRWQRFLTSIGVQFFFHCPLDRLHWDGHQLKKAILGSGEEIEADHFILACNPFSIAEVLSKTPDLEGLEQLKLFKPLTQRGPHVQVSFRLAFGEKIAWPKPRMAVILADSEFNLTLFAQEQAWSNEFNLGNDIQSLWTGTACVATVPGRKYGLPLERCTYDQFVDEVRTQIMDCKGLDELIRQANHGRALKSFPIQRFEVWHEWAFSSNGIRSDAPKWVNTTNTQPFQPDQATPIPNLALAGAHTKTQADVWSIEAAVESGRRAARVFDPDIQVLEQYRPAWLRILATLDDGLFRLGAPHWLDLLFIVALLGLTWKTLQSWLSHSQ